MALKKKQTTQQIESKIFEDYIQAQIVFKDINNSEDLRVDALEFLISEQSINHMLKLTNMLFGENKIEDHIYIDIIFNSFHGKNKTDKDYDELLKTLQSTNVYLRNMAIKYLQESNEEAIFFIEKLLKNDDKDIRIFALNILGDVKYDKSVDILRYFLVLEKDINVIMTAVDYIGEIGSIDDIALLESLKLEHKDNQYLIFGVDLAIDKIKG